MLRILLHRLTTDPDALRRTVDRLTADLTEARAELAKLRTLPPVYNAALSRIAALEAEVTRLTPLAGNLNATPAEADVLAVVRASPGATAKEIGLAVCTRTHVKVIAEWRAANPDGTPPEWMTRAVDPDNYLVDLGAKPLTGLHKKGLVRREPAGRSFRYWPTESA